MLLNRSRLAVLSLLVLVTLAFDRTTAVAQSSISVPEAKNHIGEKQTVCGNVVSTHYADQKPRQPHFSESG